MSKDYAKRGRGAAAYGSPKWVHFVAGFASGVLASLLMALWYLDQDAVAAKRAQGTEASAQQEDQEALTLDFYEIFPKREVPIEDEYSAAASATSGLSEGQAWVLQTGSFRSAEDANQLRAQLILLGMNAEIQKTRIDGKDWHRVMAGPFGTDQARKSAQAKLAQARIAFLPLRVTGN